MARCSWADLPMELLLEIFHRVPCRADRRIASNVCTSWREALTLSQPPPAPLPWLLVTSGSEPTLSCVLSKEAEHQVDANHAAPPARYFGSYEGAWVLGAFNQTSDHVALHLRTGTTIDLPDVHRVATEDLIRIPMFDIVILAATLSSAPDLPGCVAAGLITDRRRGAINREIAFWRNGDVEAVGRFELYASVGTRIMPHVLFVEDLLFHDGAFYFITREGECHFCTPHFLEDGTVQANFEAIYVSKFDAHIDSYIYRPVLARYLVQSRGALLMVLRCSESGYHQTSDFMVFKMVQVRTCADGRIEYDWEQLPHLDGRILFVGRGYSRSYEASLYPGIGEGVYFHDDSEFDSDSNMFEDEDRRKYLCHDNGKWPGTGLIEPPSPDPLKVSSYSPPIWLLP